MSSNQHSGPKWPNTQSKKWPNSGPTWVSYLLSHHQANLMRNNHKTREEDLCYLSDITAPGGNIKETRVGFLAIDLLVKDVDRAHYMVPNYLSLFDHNNKKASVMQCYRI